MNSVAIPHQLTGRDWSWLLLLAGFGICCTAILLFPCLVLQGKAAAALSIQYVFSHVCHQDPQRSLSLANVFLPVCNRCLVLYLGGFLGVLLAVLVRSRSVWFLSRPSLLLGPLLLTGLDASLDLAGVWSSTLWSRTATGGAAGLVLGLYLTLFQESQPVGLCNNKVGIATTATGAVRQSHRTGA